MKALAKWGGGERRIDAIYQKEGTAAALIELLLGYIGKQREGIREAEEEV